MAVDVLTLKEIYNRETDGFLPSLIEIFNPDIAWTEEEKSIYEQDNGCLRVINDVNTVKYKGHKWLPCSFNVTQPDSDGTKIGTGSISISALDARVRKILKQIKLESEVRIVASFVKTTRQNGKLVYKFTELNSITLYMNAAGSTNTSATFNLAFKGLSGNAPYDVATQDRTPSVNV